MILAMLLVAATLRTPVEVHSPGCDDVGRCTFVVRVPEQPKTLVGGDEANVWVEIFEFELPQSMYCFQQRSFLGLDDGDKGEFDIYLNTRSQYHVLKRSFHRHSGEDFDSWLTNFTPVTAKKFDLVVVGRVTGENDGSYSNNKGKLAARMHVGLEMTCQASITTR